MIPGEFARVLQAMNALSWWWSSSHMRVENVFQQESANAMGPRPSIAAYHMGAGRVRRGAQTPHERPRQPQLEVRRPAASADGVRGRSHIPDCRQAPPRERLGDAERALHPTSRSSTRCRAHRRHARGRSLERDPSPERSQATRMRQVRNDAWSASVSSPGRIDQTYEMTLLSHSTSATRQRAFSGSLRRSP